MRTLVKKNRQRLFQSNRGDLSINQLREVLLRLIKENSFCDLEKLFESSSDTEKSDSELIASGAEIVRSLSSDSGQLSVDNSAFKEFLKVIREKKYSSEAAGNFLESLHSVTDVWDKFITYINNEKRLSSTDIGLIRSFIEIGAAESAHGKRLSQPDSAPSVLQKKSNVAVDVTSLTSFLNRLPALLKSLGYKDKYDAADTKTKEVINKFLFDHQKADDNTKKIVLNKILGVKSGERFDLDDLMSSAEKTKKIEPLKLKPKQGLLQRLKGMFKEGVSRDPEVLAGQIVKLVVEHRRMGGDITDRDVRRLVREMIDMHHSDMQASATSCDTDEMGDQWGPSETGPFDAPDEEHPGYMLLGNLKRLAAKAEELAGLASPWDDAEPWIESKVNSAAEHLDAVHDYIMYSVLDQDFDPMEHEEMMYECGEMPGGVLSGDTMAGDMMHEPLVHGRYFGDGGSASMARGQLFQIAKKAQSMSDRLTDDDTLPEWLQSKVAMAYQTIATVSDYMDYKMSKFDMGDPMRRDL